jgi:hypothetical protein
VLEEIDGEPLIFLPHLRKAEEGIAAKIRRLAAADLIVACLFTLAHISLRSLLTEVDVPWLCLGGFSNLEGLS